MIIVTGGSGQAGKACVRDLQEHGYDITSVDLAPPVDGSVRFSRVDLTDFGQTMAALSAIDERVTKVTGVVHLAAIRAPGLAPNHVTFETNILSTYNVFEAARQLGIKNIVWASGGDSPAELMIASATGDDTVAKPFVGRTGFETLSPNFSPDGKQIVFVSPRPLTPQLFTMNVNGTGLRPLTPVVPGKRSYRTGPDWSPNGDEIAFQQQNGDFQVWTIGVKDRVMKQLTNEGENENPSWAPDGRHMSITRRLGAIGDPRNIWVLDVRTGRLRQLTQSPGDARMSDWSPPLKATF